VVILDAMTKAIGGFANHAKGAPLLMLVVVTAFSIAAGASKRGEGRSATVAARDDLHAAGVVALCSLCLVIPYTYIGLNRLVNGGYEIFTGDALARRSAGGRARRRSWECRLWRSSAALNAGSRQSARR
jgi:hypothetical protein